MDLKALIAWARGRTMTLDEKTEQRRSFAYGNCHLANEKVTREMVADADRRLNGQSGTEK